MLSLTITVKNEIVACACRFRDCRGFCPHDCEYKDMTCEGESCGFCVNLDSVEHYHKKICDFYSEKYKLK